MPRDKVIHCFQVCVVERQPIRPSVLPQIQWKTFQQWSCASCNKCGTMTQRPPTLTAAVIAKSQRVLKSAESNFSRTVDCAEAARVFWGGPGGEKSLLLSWVADQLSLHWVFTQCNKYLTIFFCRPQNAKATEPKWGKVKVNRGAAPARPLTRLLNTAGGAQTQQACLMEKDLYWFSKPANAIRDSKQEPVGSRPREKWALSRSEATGLRVCVTSDMTMTRQSGAAGRECGGYPTPDTPTVKRLSEFDIWTCWWKTQTLTNSHWFFLLKKH